MVHQIINNRYRIFVESLLVTCVVFIIGFSLGYYVETFRTDSLIKDYKNYEVEALDLKLQNYYYQIMDRSSCSSALEQNFVFADKLYTRGLEIEKYEEAAQITDDLLIEKKKYVLLKTELWLNTLLLKDKCHAPLHTLVYLYSSDPNDNALVAKQQILSNVLRSVKEQYNNSLVLLPIAGDLNLEAVNLQMRVHNITELPSIIIDERVVLTGFQSAEKIDSYLQ